ncbi:ATP-binding protein [Nonomuraea sp. NPDC004702]
MGEEFPDLAPGLVMSTFRSRELWGGMAWRQAFPGRGEQSAPARRMVGWLLADTGRREDAEWVTAELVSNTLRHTRSGQARGFFVVEVLRGTDVARIVVYDLGGGPVPDFTQTSGSIPGLAEHGRGLAGVAALATRYGAAGDPSTGHAVWADLALPGEGVQAAAAGDAAGAGGRGPEPGGLHKLMSMSSGEATKNTKGVITGISPSPLDERTSSGSAAGLKSFPRREGASTQEADQASAFGQEPWAQQALAGLRRDWPDWAFLVVRSRWLAMRGPQIVISAAGSEELRRALPPIPRKPLSIGSESGASVLNEYRAAQPYPSATVSELLGAQPHEDRRRAGTSSPPASGTAMGGDGGVVAGLSGTLTAVAPLSAVVAAERSGTGTWAVVAAGPARAAWWPRVWPKRWRGRSRAGARVPEGDRRAALSGLPAGGGPRHRRVRSKPIAVAAVLAT